MTPKNLKVLTPVNIMRFFGCISPNKTGALRAPDGFFRSIYRYLFPQSSSHSSRNRLRAPHRFKKSGPQLTINANRLTPCVGQASD